MIRWLLNLLAPKPTPDDQALIEQLRNVPLPEVTPEMRERAMARFRASVEGPAHDEFAAYRGIVTAAPEPVTTGHDTAESLLDEIRRTWDALDRAAAAEEPRLVSDRYRPSPLTADELDAEVAAYEAGAAERARRAGFTWPTNPAPAGTARYANPEKS